MNVEQKEFRLNDNAITQKIDSKQYLHEVVRVKNITGLIIEVLQ